MDMIAAIPSSPSGLATALSSSEYLGHDAGKCGAQTSVDLVLFGITGMSSPFDLELPLGTSIQMHSFTDVGFLRLGARLGCMPNTLSLVFEPKPCFGAHISLHKDEKYSHGNEHFAGGLFVSRGQH